MLQIKSLEVLFWNQYCTQSRLILFFLIILLSGSVHRSRVEFAKIGPRSGKRNSHYFQRNKKPLHFDDIKIANRQNANICLILFFQSVIFLLDFPFLALHTLSLLILLFGRLKKGILIQGNRLMVNGYTTRCFPVLTLIISGHELQPIERTKKLLKRSQWPRAILYFLYLVSIGVCL